MKLVIHWIKSTRLSQHTNNPKRPKPAVSRFFTKEDEGASFKKA